MEIFKKSQELVIYSNRDDSHLNVEKNILTALCEMQFLQDCEANGEGEIKLIIWHGDPPQVSTQNPTVLLQMSSQGFSKCPEIFVNNNKIEVCYYVQGGINDPRLPSNSGEWKELIDWLLRIDLHVLNVGVAVPLPDDPKIRKFIYTEPYPDALVAWYLAKVAKQKDIEINYANLPEDIENKADAEYKELAKAHGQIKGFDISGIRELFEKIAKT